ncbi:hypothetical protein [Mariniphaga sediminis]
MNSSTGLLSQNLNIFRFKTVIERGGFISIVDSIGTRSVGNT